MKTKCLLALCTLLISATPVAQAHGLYVSGRVSSKMHKVTTPKLILAIEDGNYHRVLQYLDAGENPNTKNRHNDSALSVAISRSEYKIANLLLERGADANASDRYNNSPLHLAIMMNSPVYAVLGDGSVGLAANPEQAALFKRLLDMGADIHAKNASGCTPLHLAVRYHYAEGVKNLLERGAEADARDKDGKTPLMSVRWPEDYAEKKERNADAKDLALLLLEKGADVNAADNKGGTALMSACIGCSGTGVDFLMEHGADLNARDEDGKTALGLVLKRLNQYIYDADEREAYRKLAESLVKRGAKE